MPLIEPIEELERARSQLSALRRELGDENTATLVAFSELARAYRNVEDFLSATKVSEESLAIRRRVQGELHPDTLRAMGVVGLGHYRLGDLEKALEVQTDLFDRCIQYLENEDLTGFVMKDLAKTLKGLGRYDAYREMLSQAVEWYRRVKGDLDPETVSVMDDLAYADFVLGNFLEAFELDSELCNLYAQTHGMDAAATLRVRARLAGDLMRLGRPAESLNAITELVEVARRVLDPASPIREGIEQDAIRIQQIHKTLGDEFTDEQLRQLLGLGDAGSQ
jgi:tetratricopeptide (TPR) repeat protein